MLSDYLGNEIFEGSIVVYMQLGYRDLKIGMVTKLCNTKIKITAHAGGRTISQRADQVIVANKLISSLRILEITNEIRNANAKS